MRYPDQPQLDHQGQYIRDPLQHPAQRNRDPHARKDDADQDREDAVYQARTDVSVGVCSHPQIDTLLDRNSGNPNPHLLLFVSTPTAAFRTLLILLNSIVIPLSTSTFLLINLTVFSITLLAHIR